MNTLILGAEGQVGTALSRKIPNAVLGTHKTMDITDYASMFAAFSTHRPDIVYMAAGITNVDKCEDLKTGKVNLAGAMQVARLCDMFGAKLVYFSSAYVFGGESRVPYSEQDIVGAIQNYGKQKTRVEYGLLQNYAPKPNCVIIRTVGVFGDGPKNRNFVRQVVKAIRHGEKVKAPIDQYMNPILVSDLAAISIVLGLKHTGVFHVAGDECINKYQFAARVADYFGKSRLVEGVASAKLDQAAPRPRMACLDCTELTRLGMSVPSFENGLHKYLATTYG